MKKIISLILTLMLGGLITYSWVDHEKGFVRKVTRKQYEMRLYRHKVFYVLRYYTPEGKQIGVSYWRVDHKTKPTHIFTKELKKWVKF